MRVSRWSSWSASVVAFTLATFVFQHAEARAEDRPLAEAITLATADECFALAPLLEHLESFLGRATLDTHLAAVIEVGDGAASFEVLRDGNPGGRRRFGHLPRACEDRRAVVALALALALDERADIAPVHEPPSAAPPAARQSPAVSAAPVEAAVSHALGVSLSASGGVLVGVLPVAAPALVLELMFSPVEGLSVGVGGVATPELSVPIGGGLARVDLLGGRISACLERTLAGGRFVLAGCVSGWLAGVRASGEGFAQDRDGMALWFALSMRVQLAVRVTEWLAIFLATDGVLVPIAPSLEVVSGRSGGARRARSRWRGAQRRALIFISMSAP